MTDMEMHKGTAVFIFDNPDNVLRNRLESPDNGTSREAWQQVADSIRSGEGVLAYFTFLGSTPKIDLGISPNFHQLGFRFNIEAFEMELDETRIRSYAAAMINYPMVLAEKKAMYTFSHID